MPEDINNVVAVADVLNELAHRFLLCVRPGILCLAVLIQSALIADTDTFTVEATGVRTDAFERTGRFDVPILANIKMIPHTVETTTTVANVQVVLGETLVLTSGGTVDDNRVSHYSVPLSCWLRLV